MGLVTQGSYERRQKCSTIPSALVKEKAIKQEPIQRIQVRQKQENQKDKNKNNNYGGTKQKTTVDSADDKPGHHFINDRWKQWNASNVTKEGIL